MVNFINIGQDENLEDVISTMSDTLLNSRWFKITYFHKGLGEEVTRYGRFNDQCKVWETKKGELAVIYEQVDDYGNSEGFRTATQIEHIHGKRKAVH